MRGEAVVRLRVNKVAVGRVLRPAWTTIGRGKKCLTAGYESVSSLDGHRQAKKGKPIVLENACGRRLFKMFGQMPTAVPDQIVPFCRGLIFIRRADDGAMNVRLRTIGH